MAAELAASRATSERRTISPLRCFRARAHLLGGRTSRLCHLAQLNLISPLAGWLAGCHSINLLCLGGRAARLSQCGGRREREHYQNCRRLLSPIPSSAANNSPAERRWRHRRQWSASQRIGCPTRVGQPIGGQQFNFGHVEMSPRDKFEASSDSRARLCAAALGHCIQILATGGRLFSGTRFGLAPPAAKIIEPKGWNVARSGRQEIKSARVEAADKLCRPAPGRAIIIMALCSHGRRLISLSGGSGSGCGSGSGSGSGAIVGARTQSSPSLRWAGDRLRRFISVQFSSVQFSLAQPS